MQIPKMMTCLAAVLMTASAGADQYGLEQGKAALQSAGPMAFGPDGVLFVADTKAAAVYAIAVEDELRNTKSTVVNVDGLNVKLAQLLKADSGAVTVADLAVSPNTGNVYLTVMAGDSPAIVRVGGDGKLEQVSLENIRFAKAELPSPPEDAVTGQGRRRRNNRNSSVTDLAYFDGRLIVSGLTNKGPNASVMSVGFPFSEFSPPAALEIYHGAHGKFEDSSNLNAFVPFVIDGEPHLLAGYQCTPLVKFPLDDLKAGKKVLGTTVAELGNRNRPYDMISYEKDGKSFLLMANSARGVMKISTDDIARKEGITERINGTAGQEYDTITDLDGTVQLAQANDTHAVIVQQSGNSLDLKTVALP